VAFGECELMQNAKVAPAIDHPRYATRIQKRHDATSVLPAKPRGAVKITVFADY
jgi:hypothetical protein